jgi:hypothetical protein
MSLGNVVEAIDREIATFMQARGVLTRSSNPGWQRLRRHAGRSSMKKGK